MDTTRKWTRQVPDNTSHLIIKLGHLTTPLSSTPRPKLPKCIEMRSVLLPIMIAAFQILQLGAATSQAAPPPDPEAEASSKITHIWVKFAQAHPDEEITSTEAEWENALRPTLENIIETEVAADGIPETELRATTRRSLDLIRWETLFEKVKNVKTLIKTTARLKGLGAVAALSLSITAEISIPIALTALGHPGLALLSPYMPYHIGGLSIASANRRFKVRSQMIDILGGRDNYTVFINQQKGLRKSLKLKSAKDLLFPIPTAGGKFEAAVVSESNLFQTTLEKLGLSGKRMTFSNLKSFCKTNNVGVQYAQDLDNLTGLSKQLKTTYLLSYLHSEAPDTVITRMREIFSSSMVELGDLGNAQEFMKFRTWALRMSRATSPQEAYEILKLVPEGTSPALVGKVWEKITLPSLALTSPDVSYRDFRNLMKHFTELSVSCEKADSVWDQNWLGRFQKYIAAVTHSQCGTLLDSPVDELVEAAD